jgi:hypothetical protein
MRLGDRSIAEDLVGGIPKAELPEGVIGPSGHRYPRGTDAQQGFRSSLGS